MTTRSMITHPRERQSGYSAIHLDMAQNPPCHQYQDISLQLYSTWNALLQTTLWSFRKIELTVCNDSQYCNDTDVLTVYIQTSIQPLLVHSQTLPISRDIPGPASISSQGSFKITSSPVEVIFQMQCICSVKMPFSCDDSTNYYCVL